MDTVDTLDIRDRASFAWVADVITDRTAELLQTRTFLSDEHGIVIAASDPRLVGQPSTAVDRQIGQGALRLPLNLDAHVAELIVARPSDGAEPIPRRLAQALVDLVVSQVMGHDGRSNPQERRNRFLYDLLRGTVKDRAAILREAKVLGLDLAPPRAVILIDAAEYLKSGPSRPGSAPPREVRRRARVIIDSVVKFFELPNDTICVHSGDGEVAVLKASDSKNLFTWVDDDDEREPPGSSWANLDALKRAGRALLDHLRDDTGATLAVGIGRYHPGIAGLARSYQDARAALSLGRRFHGADRVLCLDELGIASFVGIPDERTKVELARHLLSPLDHEPELLETLEAFFGADCAPSPTAQRLAIHRNTLTYRLDKIATLTGLDPRRFDEAVQIRLALLLRSLGDAPA